MKDGSPRLAGEAGAQSAAQRDGFHTSLPRGEPYPFARHPRLGTLGSRSRSQGPDGDPVDQPASLPAGQISAARSAEQRLSCHVEIAWSKQTLWPLRCMTRCEALLRTFFSYHWQDCLLQSCDGMYGPVWLNIFQCLRHPGVGQTPPLHAVSHPARHVLASCVVVNL